MNRLGLYVNYDNQPDKAAALIDAMEKSIATATVTSHGYLSIYRYCVGSYYLNKKEYEKAIEQFNLAVKESDAAPEAFWAATDYRAQLTKKLNEAQSALPKEEPVSETQLAFA